MLTVSPAGREFIAAHEGVVLKAYRCPAGVLTIGVGHTSAAGAPAVTAGMTITRAEAFAILAADLKRFEARTCNALTVGVVPHQQAAFDGAVSFDFNTGRVHNATWPKLFAARKFAEARASLLTWNKGGGKVLAGLTRRRREEAALIFDEVYPAGQASSAADPVTTGWAQILIFPQHFRVPRAALTTF